MFKERFLKAFLRKWRKLGTDVRTCATHDYVQLTHLACTQEEEGIPGDVPKGHMVVYVGEECKRFVIRVALLEHPLFQALLDQAREEYEFKPYSKLWIPCDETLFLTILRRVNTQQDRKIWFCI